MEINSSSKSFTLFLICIGVKLVSSSHVQQNGEKDTFIQKYPTSSFINPQDSTKVFIKSLLKPKFANRRSAKQNLIDSSTLCDGVCMNVHTCDRYEGMPVSSSSCDKNRICCKFQKVCNTATSDMVSIFESPNYPQLQNGSTECKHEIYTREDVCALKIEFLDFNLTSPVTYGVTKKCIYDAMYILNTLDDTANENVCSMKGHTAVVYVNQTSTKPVLIAFMLQGTYLWKLRVTQINCKTLRQWTNELDCGKTYISSDSEGEEKNMANALPDLTSQDEDFEIYSPIDLTPFIVNGEDAVKREFPWIVSIQNIESRYHLCGGSIINNKFVLTAAHCVVKSSFTKPEELIVSVGDHTLNSTDDGEEELFGVETIVTMFHYKTYLSFLNDIAILKLNKSVQYGDTIRPICMPEEDFNTDGMTATISGWGRKNSSDYESGGGTLQKIEVDLLSDEDCREYARAEYSHLLKKNVTTNESEEYGQMGFTRTQICAIAVNKTSCFGDSGGPLVVPHENGDFWTQVGVVSYGLGQCITERLTPVAYTRVSEYLKFIRIATNSFL